MLSQVRIAMNGEMYIERNTMNQKLSGMEEG
jgi:hypothetical protein